MTQYYSDPTLKDIPNSLPDVEVFYISQEKRPGICEGEGEWHTQQPSTRQPCDDCPPAGWYYWYCLPGCLPSTEPTGPFKTEAEAIKDFQIDTEA